MVIGWCEGERWCEGGERAFVTKHIRESVSAPPAVWFTSLVSSEASLPKLLHELRLARAATVEQLILDKGNKRSRVLAWSFLNKGQRRTLGQLLWG